MVKLLHLHRFLHTPDICRKRLYLYVNSSLATDSLEGKITISNLYFSLNGLNDKVIQL
jgi:hypothetical protein